MRTLYQHTARRSKIMREYVDLMRDHGAQIRTLDEFFNRLIIIDRRMALVPGETNETAVAIHDQHLVSYLADVFERSWERGRDYEGSARTRDSEIASEVRQLTVRMLDRGPQRLGQRQAGGRQHAHLRVVRRRAQGGVRRRDALPAGTGDGTRGLGVSPRDVTGSEVLRPTSPRGPRDVPLTCTPSRCQR